jgi:hypothetical protein
MRHRLVAAVVAFALVTPCVFARADISGKWSGPVKLERNGETKDDTLSFEFKQTGNDLTGSGAPANDTPDPLKGKVDGTKVTFDVTTTGGPVIHFDLTLDNGHLKGTLLAEQNGTKMTGTVDLQKAK